jgi:E3 ubiquitin-protein ligase SHPRH
MRLEDITDEYQMNTIIAEVLGEVHVGIKNVEEAIFDVHVDEVKAIDRICIICMEDFIKIKDVQIVRTCCNHYFCKECIMKWFMEKPKCPLCLYEFNK